MNVYEPSPTPPVLDYAGPITRTGLAYQQTPDGLIIRMPRPRLRDLPFPLKLGLAGPVVALLSGIWILGLVSLFVVLTVCLLVMRKQVVLSVRDGRLHVSGLPGDMVGMIPLWPIPKSWPVEQIESITVAPEGAELTLRLKGREMLSLTGAADRHVLEWVAGKLNEVIRIQQCRIDTERGRVVAVP